MRQLLYIILLILGIQAFSQEDYRIQHAIRSIKSNYGVDVYVKAKSLRKFGRNPDISTTEETVWNQGGKEVYPTGNDITKASSSSASDTVTMYYEGHTRTGDIITFTSDYVTLNGQTPAIVVPAGADIHIDAISSGSGTDVTATLAGYLAKVKGT